MESEGLQLRRAGFAAVSAILAALIWLAAEHQLRAQTSPTFTRITSGPLVTDLGSSFGATVADYDGDGYLDVYVARYLSGRSGLYHNNGDGTFVGVTNGVFPVSRGRYTWASGVILIMTAG
jgi:hypothetical protein